MINYRLAKIEDAREIKELLHAAFEGYSFFDMITSGLKDKDKFIEQTHFVNTKVYIKNQLCYIGVEDGKIVSMMQYERFGVKSPAFLDFALMGGAKLLFLAGIPGLIRLKSLVDESMRSCRELGKGVYYLEEMAVNTKISGKGYGSKMIQDFIIPFISKNGGGTLTLITNSEVNRKFYKKNGFEEFSENVLKRNNKEMKNWSYKMVISRVV